MKNNTLKTRLFWQSIILTGLGFLFAPVLLFGIGLYLGVGPHAAAESFSDFSPLHLYVGLGIVYAIYVGVLWRFRDKGGNQ